MLRCDYGTENTSLATVQIAFRIHHSDSLAGERSFMYGPSKSNIVSCNWLVSIMLLRTYIFYRRMLLCRELKPSGPNYGNPKPVGGLTFARCSSLQLHVYVIPAQCLYSVRKPKNMGNHIPFFFLFFSKRTLKQKGTLMVPFFTSMNVILSVRVFYYSLCTNS